MEHKDVESLLARRSRAPNASHDLAERIIFAALQQPAAIYRAADRFSWSGLWADMTTMFYGARPAYALAASLVIGIVVGLQGGDSSGLDPQQDWISFLNFDEGTWL